MAVYSRLMSNNYPHNSLCSFANEPNKYSTETPRSVELHPDKSESVLRLQMASDMPQQQSATACPSHRVSMAPVDLWIAGEEPVRNGSGHRATAACVSADPIIDRITLFWSSRSAGLFGLRR
jgi:hypothetical protein